MFKWLLFTFLCLIPLTLAATNFTLLTFPFSPSSFTISFFAYSYQNGWGYTYQSDFSLLQVLTYTLAYVSGIFLLPLIAHPHFLAKFAQLISLAGALSFSLELTHWLIPHHLSIILSLPVILWLIAFWSFLTTLKSHISPTAGRHSVSIP
ncbi:MAG TPA: hypothetical protein VGN88_08250 [Phycisphaerae bacterium]|jgi:hypothetical protein